MTLHESTHETALVADRPPKGKQIICWRRFGWWGIGIAACGLIVALWAQPDLNVNAVQLSAKQGLDIASGFKGMLPSPNLYVEVWSGPHCLTSGIVQNAVIGNGLTFELPNAIPLQRIDEVKVWQKHSIVLAWHTSLVDRIAHPDIEAEGSSFHFKMVGTSDRGQTERTLGVVTLTIGIALALLAAIAWLRAHAISAH